jgi:large subunit ribosomal protein L4
VAEFNTYDILRQRYLVLTREALTSLKEQAKHKPTRRPAAANGSGAPATSTPAAPAPAPTES